MTANELIKQVASLPVAEQAHFRELFRDLEINGNGPSPGTIDRSAWRDFGERLDEIYGDRVVPDSTSIIDAGRGERG